MPTYEYECTVCGQHIEIFQRFSEDALTTCGVCGGALRKVFHPAGIVFKGSGFYATDSRSKASSGAGTKDSDGGSSSSESGSTGSTRSEGGSEGGSTSKGADGGASSKDSNGGSTSTTGRKTGSKKEPSSQ